MPRDQRKEAPPERKGQLEAYRWSSHRAYAGTAAAEEAPDWLSLDWLAYWVENWAEAAGKPRDLAAAGADDAESDEGGARGDEPLRLQMRVELGGERMTELAREFGYRDGNGVPRVVQRLEVKGRDDEEWGRRLRGRRDEVDQGK